MNRRPKKTQPFVQDGFILGFGLLFFAGTVARGVIQHALSNHLQENINIAVHLNDKLRDWGRETNFEACEKCCLICFASCGRSVRVLAL